MNWFDFLIFTSFIPAILIWEYFDHHGRSS